MRLIAYCRKSSEAEDRQILSIESQRSELLKIAAGDPALTIVSFIEESKSAKAPGRPLFDAMIASIERGEADGIIAWHPDRLARNSMDGGRIIYLLDQGRLKTLRFATFTFENNPQGKFMLSITFGYSKYYVDTLSENVRRGNRTKIEKGVLPHRAPFGYLNEPISKTIIADSERFDLVKAMWRLLLDQRLAPQEILQRARSEWGLTTPTRKRSGGALLSRAGLYRVFSNPFYAGVIPLQGRLYPGQHPAMVTYAEFEQARLLINPAKVAPRARRSFAYTGTMRCGVCARPVNRYGSTYVYYHCTHNGSTKCREPSIELRRLEEQILEALSGLTISSQLFAAYLLDQRVTCQDAEALEAARIRSQETALAEIARQMDSLVDLRLRNLIDDEGLIRRRDILERRRVVLAEAAAKASREEAIEPVEDVVSLMSKAVFLFEEGDTNTRRLLFETIGSNPTLVQKKLSFEAAVPFRWKANSISRLEMCAWRDEIRTVAQSATSDEAAAKRLRNIHTLAEMARKLPEPPELQAA